MIKKILVIINKNSEVYSTASIKTKPSKNNYNLKIKSG